jgi:hypothetical protein
MVSLKISPYTTVTFTFEFDLGLDHPVHGDMGEGALRDEERNCQKRKLKSAYGARHQDKLNWPTDRWSQDNNLNLCDCTSNYRPVLSSERAPYMKKK